jgi:CHAT domain-containing protein
VVLSTCDSAKGFEKGSEGIIGLRRSLAVAGARSSILSLWKIDDEATSQFMINFYKRLKSGESRLQALLNTQKDFRSGLINNGFDDEWKNEYYWGAFQLSGDWRPIDFN